MTVPAFDFTTRVRPIVEIGLSSSSVPVGATLWDVAMWDTPSSRWSGVDAVWVEVTCDGIAAHIQTGRQRIGDAFEPATAEVTFLNLDGWADPQAVPVSGELVLRPGLEIRVGMVHAVEGTVWRFRGYIDSVDAIFTPDDDDTVIVLCHDAMTEAGRAKVANEAVVGADETAAERFARILDAAPWVASRQLIDDDTTPMVACTMTDQIVDMLQRTAASCAGYAFGDTEGRIVLRDRAWMLYDEDDPYDAIIANGTVDLLTTEDGDPLTTEDGDPLVVSSYDGIATACPSGWRRPLDREAMATRVILDRQMPPDAVDDPEPLTFDDAPGQLLYGVEPWEQLDLWTRDDADLERIAMRALSLRSYSTMPRIDWVELDAATSDAAVDVLTMASPFTPSRWRCELTKSRGQVFDEVCFVTGITEDITPSEWVARVSLDRADLFATAGLGEWDGPAYWDRSLWN